MIELNNCHMKCKMDIYWTNFQIIHPELLRKLVKITKIIELHVE